MLKNMNEILCDIFTLLESLSLWLRDLQYGNSEQYCSYLLNTRYVQNDKIIMFIGRHFQFLKIRSEI